MPITTKMTEVQNGITFGYSDTCKTLFNSGNWKVSELARFSWCRWKDKYMGCMSSTDLNVTTPQGAAVESLLSYFQGDGARNKIKYVDNRITGEPYAFNILMYGRNNDLCLTSDNANNYRVVTSCSDFQKLYVQVNRYSEGNNRTVRFPVQRTIKENNLLWSSGGVYNTDTGSYTEWITVWTVIVINENTFFVTRGMAFPYRTPCLYDGSIGNAQNNIRPSNAIEIHNDAVSDIWYYSYSDITTYNKSKHLLRWYKNGLRITDTITFSSDYDDACWDVDDDVSIFLTGRATNSSRGNYTYTYYLRTENAVKNAIAYTGLRWRYAHGDTDHIYTPIIDADGYITGYSTDPNAKTKLKDIIDVTGNNIAPLPPTPPAGAITDKEANMPLAYISGNAGMVTFYEINKTGLASADDISDAISRFDISQIGKDVLRNLISFKAFAAINVNDTVDRQIKIAGIPLEDSGGNALTGRVIGGVKPIDLFATSGGVTIPTLYNDYRDYEPFTKIQMYVPFCGWFTLPSWCIGKKITGTMFTDLYNGTVKAVIYASQTVVAEVGGCCAYDIPFVADATGAKASAVISSALTTAAAVGATVAMPNVATGIAAVSSAANLAATLNGNDTTLKGVLGDGSNLNGLLHVYIKVSRPKSPNGSIAIPDSYKHEIGIPTMKEVKISAGDGYIQVMDAKVTGTMTAREKQMIVDGFRHGLNF